MRELREMRNKRRNRKKGKIYPLVLGGLVVLFFSGLLLAYLDFEKADVEGVAQPESAGRMVISDSPEAKIPSVQEKASVASSARKGVRKKSESVLGTSFDQGNQPQGMAKEPIEEKSQGEFTFYKSLGENLVGLGNPSKIPVQGLKPKIKNPEPKSKKSVEVQPQKKSNEIYTIQIAAFREKGHAEALIQKLKGKGLPAYLQIKDGERGPDWYRVRVGKYQGQDEAQQKAKYLQGGGGFPPLCYPDLQLNQNHFFFSSALFENNLAIVEPRVFRVSPSDGLGITRRKSFSTFLLFWFCFRGRFPLGFCGRAWVIYFDLGCEGRG